MPKNPKFIEHDVPEEFQKNNEHKNKPRSKKAEQFAVLREIYKEDDGEKQDFSKLESVKRSKKPLIIGLLLFFAILAAVSWAGFFIFKPYGRFEGRGIELLVRGPEFPKAGEPSKYEFEYKNTERAAVASLELRLVVPETFRVLEMKPEPTADPHTWQLGSLSAGGKNSIQLRGYFMGPAGGSTSFQSIATYRPSNFNADFQAISTKHILISGSVTAGELEGPSEAAPGEAIEFTYRLRHEGEEPLPNFEVRLAAPENFIFESAEPPPDSEDPAILWRYESLKPEDEKEFIVRGTFAGDSSGETEFAVRSGEVKNDEFIEQRRDALALQVLRSELNLDLVVGGAREPRNYGFGETLHITLGFTNTGARDIRDITLSLAGTSSPAGLLNWSAAEISASGRRTESGFLWRGENLDLLRSLPAGGSGSVDVSVPIVNSAQSEGTDEIRLAGTALLTQIGGRNLERLIQTTPVVITLNSDFSAGAEARYFDEDGAPLGSGPLPPRVGEETNLRVFWRIKNSRHDLESVIMRATLPPNVSWTGRSDANTGVLAWEESSRAITFTIPQLDRNAGNAVANFEVSINPGESDIGQFITLTSEISAETRDKKTGAMLSGRLPALTTDLQSDAFAAGKGSTAAR